MFSVSNPDRPQAEEHFPAFAPLFDSHGRAITDLRMAVTDHCNYRCVYCRTGNEGAQYSELPMKDYFRIAQVFVQLGIRKIRLTGGEPLLRKDIGALIRRLAELRTYPDGDPLDIAITTNGHLLEDQVHQLKADGLSRITVSMDAVNPETFERITRVPGSFEKVQRGILAAKDAGLGSIKVNCVVLRGFNEDQIAPFAEFSRAHGVIVRFIEFMPLEEDRLWTPETVVPFSEVIARLEQVRPLVRLEPTAPGETAVRYTFDDGKGEIGIIAPVSRTFCGDCNRVRLTSDGKIRTCLFSHLDHDLYAVLKRGGSDEDLARFIEKTIAKKESRHHIGEPGFIKPLRSMVHIGG